jgi:glycosyltransferase involved in cell wall biosynthesis
MNSKNLFREHLKILYVVSDFASTGNPSFQPFVRSQIESIERLGHEIHIYSIDGPKSAKNYITRMPDLRRVSEKIKPDIIHAHYAYCGFTAMVTVDLCPLITSIMGDELLGRYEMNGRKKFYSYLQYPLAWWVMLLSKRIIVKSAEMLNHGMARKSHVVPNGVDFDLFKPLPVGEARKILGLDMEKVYLLFPGDPNNTRKRFELAKAASKALEIEYGTVNNLLCMRDKSQTDLVKYMNAADAMIFTSWSEGSPNVVKEAMACNLPIVTVNVGDVFKVVDGTDNCKVLVDDPKVIAEALYRIICSRSRSNGRTRIQHLRLENVAKQVVGLYYGALRN